MNKRIEATTILVLILMCSYLNFSLWLFSDEFFFYNLIENTDFKTASVTLMDDSYLLKMPNLLYLILVFKTISIFNLLSYGIWLTIIAMAVIFSFYIFMCDYTNRSGAFLFSCITFFYPTHDSTTFWILGMYIPINCSILMYSHYLINNGRYKIGSLFSFLGAFFSYSSPPFGLGLASIFLMKKQIKKFIIFVVPTICYISFGLIVKNMYHITDWKFANLKGPFDIIKHLIIQLCTTVDTFVGPSFFLKMYYAYLQLCPLSIFIGLVVLILFVLIYYQVNNIQSIDRHLLWAFLIIAILSSLQFSLTGRYPQIAFGLGNRVTFYMSLTASLFLLYVMSLSKKKGILIFSIYLFAIIGISDHWKEWSREQNKIINRISANKDIKNINSEKSFFVSYNLYSKYGPFSNLEFFSSSSREIFAYAIRSVQPVVPVYSISRQYRVDGEYIVDKKYNQRFKIDRHIYVFNSSTGRIEKINKDLIQAYIEKLPVDKRHWIQFIKNDSLKDAIIKLSPGLSYLFS
jgi:hypothetical protein